MTENFKRRFWEVSDVEAWITANVKFQNYDDTPEVAAVWWCAYRDAQTLAEGSTIKDWARTLIDGIAPYDGTNVTERLQSWMNEAGDEGQLPGIDEEIEADLKEFFNVGGK